MAVFRVQKNQNYTVMSNFHLRDTSLSLKAVGLLSKMLSLTEEWDYNIRGLASICKEGVDAIGSALKELEKSGYLVRNQIRDSKGRICDTEYIIYESPYNQEEDTAVCDETKPDADAADMPEPDAVRPDMPKPDMPKPDVREPYTENPDMDKPHLKKPAQLNKDKSSIYKSNTDQLSTNQSNPAIHAFDAQKSTYAGGVDWDEMGYEEAAEEVRLNIEYEILAQQYPKIRLDEVVSLLAEALCSKRPSFVLAGAEHPSAFVKERLSQLDASHIKYVFECMDKNTTQIRNIKKYLLTALFNAPATMDSYYAAQVNRDLNV